MEQIFVKVPRSTYLTVLTPFLMSSEEPEPADCISQSLLRVCVSLSTSLYIHFSPNSQHRVLKNINRQQTVHQH